MTALLLATLLVQKHRPLSLEELAATSAVSGVAVVERISTRIDPDTNAVYTDAALAFQELWAGSAPAGFILTQVGGTHEGRTSAIPGWNYVLRPGERIGVFATPWKGPYHVVKGMRQGLFHLDAAGGAMPDLEGPRRTLDDLRGAARATSPPREEVAPPAPPRASAARPSVLPWAACIVVALAALLLWRRRR